MTSTLKLASRPGGWPEDAPTRSALFGVTPAGFSGDTFEDLPSYFRRLSAHHGLLPWTLAFHAVAPFICGRDFESKSNAADDCYRLVISGVTEVAAKWSGALNKLTLRNDLQLRTLLPLRRCVPPKKLISCIERFCPSCYADDERAPRPKYNRLLWAIDCVTACPVHGLQLKPAPRTKRGSPQAFWLPGISRVDGSSLANDFTEEAHPHSVELAGLVAELLDDAHQHPDAFSHAPALPAFLHYATETLFEGTAANFARHLGIAKSELHGWMKGKNRPSLHRIVLIAYCCDCTVADVLLGNKVMLRIRERPPESPTRLAPRTSTGASMPADVLLAKLEEIIQSGTASCLQEAASILGVTAKFLRKVAPQKAALLVSRGKEQRQRNLRAKEDAEFSVFLGCYREILRQGTYPARRKVVKLVRERTGKAFSYVTAARFQQKAHELCGVMKHGKPNAVGNEEYAPPAFVAGRAT
jgi:transcriptional regulator with XRE-family HTH domain